MFFRRTSYLEAPTYNAQLQFAQASDHSNIGELLTARSLAYWCMDVGSKKSSGPLLHRLLRFFQVGSVNLRKSRPFASFAVTLRDPSPGQIPKGANSREGLRGAPLWNQGTAIDDLFSAIIPHFTNYPLQTQKHSDFLLWTKVVELVHSGSHLTESGLLDILTLASKQGNCW